VLSVLSAMKSQQLIQQTYYSINLTGRSGLDSYEGAEILLFSTVPSLDLGPTHPPIKGVLKTLSVGIKWPKLEVAHSYPSHATDRKTYSYTSNSANLFLKISSHRKHNWFTLQKLTNKYYLGKQAGLITIFFVALRPNVGHGLILEVSRSHTTTHHSQ